MDRADILDVAEPGAPEHALELFVLESKPAISDPIADPGLVVLPQIEHQKAA